MKKLKALLILALLTFPVVSYAMADSGDELFFKANQFYKNSNYKEAARLYTELTDTGYVSGHIFYNLGNTYFRLGDLGHAILNYERARLLIPRDADLKFNLEYAKDRTRDAVDVPTRPLATIFFWLDTFSLDELFGILSIINALFFAALILRLLHKREWTFIALTIVTVIWLVSGSSLGVKWYQLVNDPRGVIIADEVNALAGPDSKDSELFKLHVGTIVEIERVEGTWALITISEGKRGWMRKEMIEFLSFNAGKLPDKA